MPVVRYIPLAALDGDMMSLRLRRLEVERSTEGDGRPAKSKILKQVSKVSRCVPDTSNAPVPPYEASTWQRVLELLPQAMHLEQRFVSRPKSPWSQLI